MVRLERELSNMRSDDIPKLQQLVDAASDWRTAALNVGVEINIINSQINSQNVVLNWNAQYETWDIVTSG